jgi:hypothetical protein
MLNEANQRSTPAGANVKHLAMSLAKSQREILPTLRFVRMTKQSFVILNIVKNLIFSRYFFVNRYL